MHNPGIKQTYWAAKVVRMDKNMVDSITEFRESQVVLPSENEAIRQLIRFGLELVYLRKHKAI